jgi:hypothetical protein
MRSRAQSDRPYHKREDLEEESDPFEIISFADRASRDQVRRPGASRSRQASPRLGTVNEPRRPAPEPLKTNDTAAMLVGTGLWAVALIVLLIIGPGADHRWWIWTCLAGIGGGLFGLWYVHRLNRPREDPGDDSESLTGEPEHLTGEPEDLGANRKADERTGTSDGRNGSLTGGPEDRGRNREPGGRTG